MLSWWKTAKKILSGKPKGAKLIVLGVFMVSVGAVLDISFHIFFAYVFWMLGLLAFSVGLALYMLEAETELEKKK